jgi:hypothetical protein
VGTLSATRTVLVCVPLAAAVVVRLVLLGASIGGRPIQWGNDGLTLSEAAAYGDAGEVVRLLNEGRDPNAIYPVRRGAVRGRVESTPLEAARASGRAEMVQLLLDEGASQQPGR